MRTTLRMMAVEPHPHRSRPFGVRPLRLYVRVRRNGTLLLAALAALGILFMMIHWG